MKAKHPSIPWRQFLLAGSLWLVACSSDPTALDGDGDGDADVPTDASENPSFAGQVDSNGTSWTTHEFQVSAPSEISGRLQWSSSNADLDLFLMDPAGDTVESSATSSQPEMISYAATKTGTYSWGIQSNTGGVVNYQLFMTLEESELPAALPAFPGQPPEGTLFWGAAVSGNGHASRHESPTGETLGVHRTFFQWAQRLGWMQDTVRDDVEKGRLPWVSVKTPSWQAMADGLHDAEIDAMLVALDSFDSPVWLTIHHEPEGGGGINSPDDPAGPAGHIAMNRRVRQRMTALGTRNIALAPILMTYTWKKSSGRDPGEWWAPGIYDFLGVDHYQKSEASLLDATWDEVRSWAAERSVDVAVGEWGMRGIDTAAGQRVHSWFDAAANSYADGKGARVIALSAFDSALNNIPSESWELVGEQLSAFHALMEDARSILVSEL